MNTRECVAIDILSNKNAKKEGIKGFAVHIITRLKVKIIQYIAVEKG